MKPIDFSELLGLALMELARETTPNDYWLIEKADRLHCKMRELSEKYSEKLIPLKSLHFSIAGAYPYSIELARALEILQQSGIIKRDNPYYEHISPVWSDDAGEYIENRINEIFEEEEKGTFYNFVTELSDLKK